MRILNSHGSCLKLAQTRVVFFLGKHGEVGTDSRPYLKNDNEPAIRMLTPKGCKLLFNAPERAEQHARWRPRAWFACQEDISLEQLHEDV